MDGFFCKEIQQAESKKGFVNNCSVDGGERNGYCHDAIVIPGQRITTLIHYISFIHIHPIIIILDKAVGVTKFEKLH